MLERPALAPAMAWECLITAMLPDGFERKRRINSPRFLRGCGHRAATNDFIGLRNNSISSSTEGVTMTSVVDKTPLSCGTASADDRRIGFAQAAHYFCGTSHLTIGVYVGIAGTHDCYPGALADRYIVIDAGPRGVEIRSAAEAREVAEKILALADEYEALTHLG
jgi:hypothetical protein